MVIALLLDVLLGRHGRSKEGWLPRNLFNNLILVLSVIFLGGHCLRSCLGMILTFLMRRGKWQQWHARELGLVVLLLGSQQTLPPLLLVGLPPGHKTTVPGLLSAHDLLLHQHLRLVVTGLGKIRHHMCVAVGVVVAHRCGVLLLLNNNNWRLGCCPVLARSLKVRPDTVGHLVS